MTMTMTTMTMSASVHRTRAQVHFLMSAKTASATHDMMLRCQGLARAREAAEMWSSQVATLRRGIGLLQAGMVEPVMANAAISGMCKGMMDIWLLAMDSETSVVQCGHEEQSPLL